MESHKFCDETASDISSSSSPKFALTDGERETESSRNDMVNITRKRSKRTRKPESKKKKNVKKSKLGFKNVTELEHHHHPQSSVSDTTTEEDLAYCLMLLSRDKWKKKKTNKEVVEEMDTETYKESNRIMKKGRYKCETCGKVFKSYQALGGHRASHKKNREQRSETEYDVVVVVDDKEKKVHECPICYRVFASGQALGGHKRSHGIGSLSANHHHQDHVKEFVKQRMTIDLNLPAPTDEEDVSMG